MKEETKLIHAIAPNQETGAISTPIYQTSTFVQEAPGQNKGFDYSRSNNPTRQALEDLAAELEGGHSGYAFSSGLAAIDAVVKLFESGDEIIAVDDIYGGTYRSFTHIYQKFGLKVNYVDTTDAENILALINEKTKAIWLESPTNPTLKVSDIAEISKIAKANDLLLVVDNTFASPILQKPIELGADIIVHSATKYLAGHSDVIAGLVVVATEELGEQIKFVQNATGSVLGPFDSWLTIRGISTLSLRVSKQAENALKIAQYLEQRPEIDKLYYPGLEHHKNHYVAQRQQRAFGSVVSFSLKEDSKEKAEAFVSSTQLFKLAESLGGVKSLLCHPATMTHKSTPDEVRRAAGIQDSLIRLSVGIEDVEDLIEDLEKVLDAQKLATEKRDLVYKNA